jgi:hypothetical protein
MMEMDHQWDHECLLDSAIGVYTRNLLLDRMNTRFVKGWVQLYFCHVLNSVDACEVVNIVVILSCACAYVMV